MIRRLVRGIQVSVLFLLVSAGVGPQPASAGSEPFIGETMLIAAEFCPKGWANMNGQLMPINQNQALFSLLGTTFGGDGRVTFALPRAKVTFTKKNGAPVTSCIALVGIFPSRN